MSRLEFRYSVFGLLVVLVFFASCRKKIDHEIGVTVSNELPGWKRISPSPVENLYALEVYANRLYLGGTFYSEASYSGVLLNFNADDTSFNATNNGILYEGGVYDLHVFDNKLYVGGSHHHSNFGGDLISLHSVNIGGFSTSLGFAQYAPLTASVYSIRSYGDSLLVTGAFDYDNFFSPNIQTRNVEFLQFDSPIGAADVQPTIHSSCKVNNEFYVCGEQGYFGYYSGSSFFGIDYLEKSSSDVIYDMTVIGSKIFLLGNFQSSEVLKSFDVISGSWNTISSVKTSTTLEFGARLTWIDNTLYLCGNDLEDADGNATNILKSIDGNSWEGMGEIASPVRDIALYEGVFYAAGIDGLYRLNN